MRSHDERPLCCGFVNGKRCRRPADDDRDGFCDRGHDIRDSGPVQTLRMITSASLLKHVPDSELNTRFKRHFTHVESATPYEVFFPTAAQAQDDLTLLLTELERTMTFEQVDRYRNEADLAYPLPRLACFSVLLPALCKHEDPDNRELELPTHRSFRDAIDAYEGALIQSVRDGRVFLPRLFVDLQHLFSLETYGKKVCLTLLDRLVARTTDEQIDRWLVALHACLPRHRQELRNTLDSILGSYGELIDCYFQHVYGRRKAEIEYTRDENHYRRLLVDLAARGDVRSESEPPLFSLDPRQAEAELEVRVGRLYRLRDGLTVLLLQTYPTVHTATILTLPGSEVMEEAKRRYEGRYAHLRSAP